MQPSLTESNQAVLALWYWLNASLSAYHKLTTHFGSAQIAIQASVEAWQALGIHANHLKRRVDYQKNPQTSWQHFVETVQNALAQQSYGLVFLDQTAFSLSLKQIYDPPPLLFYQGNLDRLNQPQIAIVGSRKPSPHAQKITFDMAQYLAEKGYIITSGLAQGVDKYAHLGALAQAHPDQQGQTIGVMGTGIDLYYPNANADLFAKIIAEGGCLISELLPKTTASKHTFPRRNRLVAGLSLGTLVTEAALKSGSLITARLASEQGKQVFAIPSHIDNQNAEGCHHLIREGATLVYHPDQIIEDLQFQNHTPTQPTHPSSDPQILPTQNLHSQNQVNHPHTTPTLTHTNPSPTLSNLAQNPLQKSPKIPENLQPLFDHLDWHGQDLDALVSKTQLDTPTLLVQLMELELLGVIRQMAGKYLKI